MTAALTTITTAGTPSTLADLRAAYRDAVRGLTYDNAEAVDVSHAVAAAMEGKAATPEAHVAAILAVRFPCRRCAGTGRFVTMVVNGKPTGPGGVCFRCDGRGHQGAADGHRNRVADKHAMERAFRAMAAGFSSGREG